MRESVLLLNWLLADAILPPTPLALSSAGRGASSEALAFWAGPSRNVLVLQQGQRTRADTESLQFLEIWWWAVA